MLFLIYIYIYILTFLINFLMRYYFLVKCIFWWVIVSASFWSFINVKQCLHETQVENYLFFPPLFFYWHLLMKECCLTVAPLVYELNTTDWSAYQLACFCIYFQPLHANLSELCLYQSTTGHSCKCHLYMGFFFCWPVVLIFSVMYNYLMYVLPFECDRAYMSNIRFVCTMTYLTIYFTFLY